jgi:hypothetical protein
LDVRSWQNPGPAIHQNPTSKIRFSVRADAFFRPAAQFALDVFISYSSHDVTLVRDLAEALRTAGVRL